VDYFLPGPICGLMSRLSRPLLADGASSGFFFAYERAARLVRLYSPGFGLGNLIHVHQNRSTDVAAVDVGFFAIIDWLVGAGSDCRRVWHVLAARLADMGPFYADGVV
jgi:hypothetical protein